MVNEKHHRVLFLCAGNSARIQMAKALVHEDVSRVSAMPASAGKSQMLPEPCSEMLPGFCN